ncbi:MAG: hypothetical protein LC753_20735, partial [Acidobacteria bacterium]|nr:hypothetical protein [Acidobacteriota bacterium]
EPEEGHQGIAVVPTRRHGDEVLEEELGGGREAERAAHEPKSTYIDLVIKNAAGMSVGPSRPRPG